MKENVNAHPYFPKHIILPTKYVENSNSLIEILGGFFGLLGIIFILTFVYSARKSITFGTRLKICWFVVCAVIHIILEGYFSLYWRTIVGDQSYLSQLCKFF